MVYNRSKLAGIASGEDVLLLGRFIEVNCEKQACFVLQHGVDAHDVPALKVIQNSFRRHGQEGLVRTLATFHTRLFANAFKPFVAADFPLATADLGDPEALRDALSGQEAVLSCLPYALNKEVASLAHTLGIHYFDLTEDVPTTKHIRALAETSKGIMAPQCGLAPGFVGIVGAHLAEQFERVRSIRMRVGALPQHPTGLLGYAFNWSPEGVVNEYLNDCEVIEEGVLKTVSSMEWLETLYVNGVKLEAFTTSGGLGTMCETYSDHIENLDYKTMRYPGHMALMNFFFHELLMRENRDSAGKILTHAKPPVDDDVVYVHVAAEGWQEGRLSRKEFVRAYYPLKIGGKMRTAIAWTTSASVVAVIEMVREGHLPKCGFLKQEKVPFAPFLRTRTGNYYNAEQKGAVPF